MAYVPTGKLFVPRTNMQALIEAVHRVRPPLLQGMTIGPGSGGLEVVSMEFALTPELIKAWGEVCAAMIERDKT